MNNLMKMIVLIISISLFKNLLALQELSSKDQSLDQRQNHTFLQTFSRKRAKLAELSKKIDSLRLSLNDEEQDNQAENKNQSLSSPEPSSSNEKQDESMTIWEKIKEKTSGFFEKIRNWVTSKLDVHEKKVEKQVQFSLEHFGSKLKTLDFMLSEKEKKLEESFSALQQQQASVARRDDVEMAIGDVKSHIHRLDKTLEEGQTEISKLVDNQTKAAQRNEVQKDLEGLNEKLTSTFETKLTTTEDLLRSEMDKKINELKSEFEGKSVVRGREEKGDVSSLIKQAVRKHMNLAKDDYRENRDGRKKRRIRRLLDELDDDY